MQITENLVSKCCGSEQTGETFSSCCGSSPDEYCNEDTGFCSDCRDHSDYSERCGECGEECEWIAAPDADAVNALLAKDERPSAVVAEAAGPSAAMLAGRERTRLAKIKHGFAPFAKKEPEYQAYIHAKGRCQNSSDAAYQRYGGRGIEFRFSSFEEFLAHLGRRPTPQHSLDRIDNDGHYETGNVRWATAKEQSNNRRPRLSYAQPGRWPSLGEVCTTVLVVAMLAIAWSVK